MEDHIGHYTVLKKKTQNKKTKQPSHVQISTKKHKSKLSTQTPLLLQAPTNGSSEATRWDLYVFSNSYLILSPQIYPVPPWTYILNIHMLCHGIPEHTDVFAKESSSYICSASAISQLQLTSFDSCTLSASDQSFCSHSFPGTRFNRL